MIICILAPVALCLLITSFRKMISVSFMVRSSSLLPEENSKVTQIYCGLICNLLFRQRSKSIKAVFIWFRLFFALFQKHSLVNDTWISRLFYATRSKKFWETLQQNKVFKPFGNIPMLAKLIFFLFLRLPGPQHLLPYTTLN